MSGYAYRRRQHGRGGGDPPSTPDAEAAAWHHPQSVHSGSRIDRVDPNPNSGSRINRVDLNQQCSSCHQCQQHPKTFTSPHWCCIMVGIIAIVQVAIIAVLLGHVPHLDKGISYTERKESSRSLDVRYEYPHDHPDHPWHWTRETPPDPALGQKSDCSGTSYSSLYNHFHEYGYAIFTSCSLQRNEASVLAPAGDFTKTIDKDRAMNADHSAVRRLAVDKDLLVFMEYIHGGRRLFPFQTLNFPKGTQQPLHSDLIHFDTMPRALMTAAWTALEDMNKDNGPLKFYPRSHHLGTNDYDELGIHQKKVQGGIPDYDYNRFYGEELENYLTAAGLRPEVASDIKRGQTFIWAAGLAHGGSKQNDMSLTRLSQVTHYFFEGSDYYWSPRLSDLTSGKINYKKLGIVSCRTSKFAPSGLHSCADGHIRKWLEDTPEL